MIQSKINTDNSFGGNFTEDRVKEGWNMTNVVYQGGFVKPVWNSTAWIESASQAEIDKINLQKLIAKQKEDKEKIIKEKLDKMVEDAVNLDPVSNKLFYPIWISGTYALGVKVQYKDKLFINELINNINAPDKGGWRELK